MFNCALNYDPISEDKQEVWALGLKIHLLYFGVSYYDSEGLPSGLSREDATTALFQH